MRRVILTLTAVSTSLVCRLIPVRADDTTVAPGRPLEPAAALESFELAPGLAIDLVAAEPLVRDPIALEFDADGTAYAIELPPYNQQAKPGANFHGSINRLRDRDGDGAFDECVAFADDLTYPTGILPYDGGLFVGDAPDLLYLKDTDGDGKADRRETWYTGFGWDQYGEGRLNSFRWGPHNLVYVSTGSNGGEVRHADRPDDAPTTVRQRVFAFDPRTREFTTRAADGQYGMTLDDAGRIYLCNNSDPTRMSAYDDRYIARNPRMQAPAPTISVAAEGKYAQLNRLSPVEQWRVIRTRMRASGAFAGPQENGQVSGFFTAATGVTVFRGDGLPPKYVGCAFVGEAANNLVHCLTLTPSGPLVSAKRLPTNTGEFLASRDTWFRPVHMSVGPDGALYIVDMYRELIEGADFLPPAVIAQMDPLAGIDRGRIYRVRTAAGERSESPDMIKLSLADLVQQLEHPNAWRRDTASRLLYERNDSAAVSALVQLAAKSSSSQGRIGALYALAGLDAVTDHVLLAALSDADWQVRIHALRLADRRQDVPPALCAAISALAADDRAEVRYQAAFSLGATPLEGRLPALVTLLHSDGDSPWFRAAIQSSLGDGGAAMVARILAEEDLRSDADARPMLVDLARQVAQSGSLAEVTALLKQLDVVATDPTGTALLTALLANLRELPTSDVIAAAPLPVREAIDELYKRAVTVASDSEQPLVARLQSLTLLGGSPLIEFRPIADELLAAHQAPELQAAVLAALGRYREDEVATLLLKRWPSLTPKVRASVIELLSTKPTWTLALLDAIEAGVVAPSSLDALRVEMLKSHTDRRVRERAEQTLVAQGSSSRAEVVKQYQAALDMAGDAKRGETVFEKNCATCHQLGDQGRAIGADLRAIKDRGAESILLNILDPNREVKPQFLAYVVVTIDGIAYSGIIESESATEVLLRGLDGTTKAIPRVDIESIESTGLSYMPEGLEKMISVAEMADLLAYLMRWH
jgi:putative membrane-bound dehydrogenase-like protein